MDMLGERVDRKALDIVFSSFYEMVGTDTSGNQIPMGNYKTPEAAEAALADLHNWLSAEA